MATGGRLRDSDVADIYSCAVCMEHLLDRNPRFLSCYHSFCQQCLQRLINKGQVTCPTCREITPVPNNDVTKLTMNFQLVQMMEHLKQEKQSMLSSRNCHFCNKEPIFYKCIECNKFLCESCETKHHKMKVFKGHSMSEICQEHFDGISHICMKCVQAVCVKCIVLDHADHEDKVEEYQVEVDNLKSILEDTKEKLKKKQTVIEKIQNELDSKISNASKHKKELQRTKAALLKEIEQIDHELLDVADTERKCDKDVKMYRELKEKFDVNCRNVDKLLQSPQNQIVSSFLRQSMSVKEILIETEKINIEFKLDIHEEVQWLKKPVMESNYNNLGNFQIKWPTSIKTLESDLFVYSDSNTSKFVVFDNGGDVIRSFEGLKNHGILRYVDVYKNHLYLSQKKKIRRVSYFNTPQESIFTFMPKMNSLYKMAVATDNVLICTDNDEGKVYEYNTEDDTTMMVLQGLDCPSFISVDHTPQGTRYILALGATFSANGSVKIYNESWHLLTTITEGIINPQEMAPCPGGFLLADSKSNKITLHSYTGDLVRTVLTEEDGLCHPMSLTLKFPHLWVGHGSYYDPMSLTLKFPHLWVGHGSYYDHKITCFKVFQ